MGIPRGVLGSPTSARRGGRSEPKKCQNWVGIGVSEPSGEASRPCWSLWPGWLVPRASGALLPTQFWPPGGRHPEGGGVSTFWPHSGYPFRYVYILAAVRTESGNVDVCAPVTEVVNVSHTHTHPYPYMFVHVRVHEMHAWRQANEGSGRTPQNSASGFGALAGWSGCRTVPQGTCEHENWPTKAPTEFRGIPRKWFRGSGGQVSLQNGPEGHRSMFLNLFLGVPLGPPCGPRRVSVGQKPI